MFTLQEINHLIANENPGIEYEYALYFTLLSTLNFKPVAREFQEKIISRHVKKESIQDIIGRYDCSSLKSAIEELNKTITKISLETQNDKIGPADIVICFEDSKLGISVKYSNTCNVNISGRYFLSAPQIEFLRQEQIKYSQRYIEDMEAKYNHARQWFRNRRIKSKVTEEYIDLVRDNVLANWTELEDKKQLFRRLFQEDSPIPYWIYEFRGQEKTLLITNPPIIPQYRVNEVVLSKLETSYLLFTLDGQSLGKMQVKFNNGFFEKAKGRKPDFVVDGIEMVKGAPLSSWNFSLIY